MSITSHGNPAAVEKICEWTGNKFTTDWKHRKQRFIDREAMYEWRKSQNHETVPCKHCRKMFSRRKREKHYRSNLPPQYCSQDCAAKSDNHREKARDWTIKNQPMRSEKSRLKISETKLKRYGDVQCNNQEKTVQTCLTKYGTACFLDSPHGIKSNGKRVSKFQRRIYDEILKNYPDAQLEKYLEDVRVAVDIYIPSINKVVECFGDYWHCNPAKCFSDYYNKSLKMFASERWSKDAIRIDRLRKAGYIVEVGWEKSKKRLDNRMKI